MKELHAPGLRRLPKTVKPLRNETIRSYLGRVAEANCVDDRILARVITVAEHPTGLSRIERLTVLTGRDSADLHGALPELRESRQTFDALWKATGRSGATPCWQCAATNGVVPAQKAQVLIAPDHRVCLRHRRWIALGHIDPRIDQIDVSDRPEVIKAQVRLRRLTRRHGIRAVGNTFSMAERMMEDEQGERTFTHFDNHNVFDQRMRYFFDRESTDQLSDSYLSISRFPEAVTLATLLLSPFWQLTVADGNPRHLIRFFDELRRQNLLRGMVPRAMDAINYWLSTVRLAAEQPPQHHLDRNPRTWPGELGDWIRTSRSGPW